MSASPNRAGWIEFDPSTNATMVEFMDLFVADPVVRIDFEKILIEMTALDPKIRTNVLDRLGNWAKLFNDLTLDVNQRKAIKWAANTAVLGIIQCFEQKKEQDYGN